MGEIADYYINQQLDDAMGFHDTRDSVFGRKRVRSLGEQLADLERSGGVQPIWTTLDGQKFYSPAEISDSHLVNIKNKLYRENRPLPKWLLPEMRRRYLYTARPAANPALNRATLEQLLRKARQQVFTKPRRERAIVWLKRELGKYWTVQDAARAEFAPATPRR